MKKRLSQHNALSALLGCLALFFYLAVSIYTTFHVAAHHHGEIGSAAAALHHTVGGLGDDDDSDDHDHLPHQASDHKLTFLGRIAGSQVGNDLVVTVRIVTELLACDGAALDLAASFQKQVFANPSPPELLSKWQFSSRAALPVRAPSFLS